MKDVESILLRLAIAFIWLATGLGVLHPSYRLIGLHYLEPLGLPVAVMYAVCVMEIIIGLLVLLDPPRWWLTVLQLLLIAGFTLILAFLEQALLVHPFGVLSKNVPLTALILTAQLVEDEGWTARVVWLLRLGLAFIWIWEGLFAAALFQGPQMRDLLAFTGLAPETLRILLIVLGLGQAASGVALLLLRGWPLGVLLGLHLLGLVAICVLVTLHEPVLWFHPFGPLTKNVPLIAGTVVLMRRGPRFAPSEKRFQEPT